MTSRRILVPGLLVAVVVVVYLLLTRGDEGYTLKAELPNAGGLRVNSSVKIAGVPGGSVKKIEVTRRDTALVTMKLDESAAKVGKDASVEIRPTDLLGERYVALHAGDVRNPQASGFQISKERSRLPVELDDVLNTFEGETRERIKILVNEFGIALGGRGKDLAKLLDAMPPSLQDARELVREITNETASLKNLLTRGDSLTASIDPKKDELASLITQADRTLGELSERREKIGRTLDSAPGGLRALNRTLTQLRQASTALRPASVDIKNAAAPLQQTLDAIPGFEDAARDSLEAANRAAPSLTKLGKQATGPLKALTPTLAKARDLAPLSRPLLQQLDDRGWDDIAWFVQNFSYGLKAKDALGHTLGANLTASPYIVTAVMDRLFGGGAVHGEDPDAAIRSAPKDRQKAPKATTEAAPPTPTPTPTPAPAAPTSTGASPPATPDKGLLGNLVDGVSGLLGGNAGKNSKPGSSPNGEGLSGLLDNLLVP